MNGPVKTYKLSEAELKKLHETDPPKNKPYKPKDWKWKHKGRRKAGE